MSFRVGSAVAVSQTLDELLETNQGYLNWLDSIGAEDAKHDFVASLERIATPPAEAFYYVPPAYLRATPLVQVNGVSLSVSVNIRGQHAHTPGLEPFLKWKRGEIATVAAHLTVRNFIRGAKLEKERWSGSGTSPLVYELTERALRMSISSDTITGSIHHAMELEIIQEAFTENPPKLYLSVTQITGEKRCDGIIQTRRDSRAWDQSMTAVNFETPDEVRAHSQLSPHEGQVLRNMVEPFGFGAKRLLLVCLEESVPKLKELKDALPTWLASRIEIRAVKV